MGYSNSWHAAPLDQSQKFIDFKEVQKLTTFSRPTIYRKIESGDFPAPIKISEKRIVFIESEITTWIQDKILSARKTSVGQSVGQK